MDWRKFQEDPYWERIAELGNDRMGIIKGELENPQFTQSIIAIRMRQQELNDWKFFLGIPQLFIDIPDVKQASPETIEDGLGTDN